MAAFWKMHGLGNDCVVIDGRPSPVFLSKQVVCRICDRRRGVGCDQLIVLSASQSPAADAAVSIHNADGSTAETCGNAIRCVGALLIDETARQQVVIETPSGPRPARRVSGDAVSVDMGPARWGWQDVPLAQQGDTLHLGLAVGDLLDGVGVSISNPHAVFLVDNPAAVPLEVVGPQVEAAPLFPDGANVSAVRVIDRHTLAMRIWERGAGITQACASGACAAVVAAVRRGLAEPKATVRCEGGELAIEWRRSDDHVTATGPTARVCVGTLHHSLLANKMGQ